MAVEDGGSTKSEAIRLMLKVAFRAVDMIYFRRSVASAAHLSCLKTGSRV